MVAFCGRVVGFEQTKDAKATVVEAVLFEEFVGGDERDAGGSGWFGGDAFGT